MKKLQNKRTLVLNKTTISNLAQKEMTEAQGGNAPTHYQTVGTAMVTIIAAMAVSLPTYCVPG
ncbi:MAG: hypothetical protein GY765_41275 [bacterium]|nr:hypothetical protein [bacterium]